MKNPISDVVDDAVTHAGLDLAARRIAALLNLNGVEAGDRVLLFVPENIDFIRAFFGCLYTGAVAVPAPVPVNLKAVGDRSASILRDAQPAAILCRRADVVDLNQWLSTQNNTTTRCIAIEDSLDVPGTAWAETRVSADMIAFLQYTSGSTQEPKGVMVSHGNLVANLATIRQWLGADETTRTLSWLPLIHDMGLIGNVLGSAYWGGQLLLMPPTAFVRRPFQWLRHIDRFGAHVSGAPNFAYDWCVQRVTDEQIAELDLSRWELAFNGAEPVQARTVDAFSKRFAPAGFRGSSLGPCYGLAEATLFVSGTPGARGPMTETVDAEALAHGRFVAPDADDPNVSVLVSSGQIMGCETVVVDPVSRRTKDDGEVGEIWVRGASVALGYWQREDLNAELFDASTAEGEGGFLRTGDLGVLRDGELYVVGRIKDVMVIRGRNLYPQDLELASKAADEDRCTGVGAVFTLSSTSEDVVVVQEVRPPTLAGDGAVAAVEKIKDAIVREHGIKPPSVVLVRPGAVLRTTSGKVRRSHMRDLFVRAELQALHEDLTDGARSVRAGHPGRLVGA